MHKHPYNISFKKQTMLNNSCVVSSGTTKSGKVNMSTESRRIMLFLETEEEEVGGTGFYANER